MKTKWMDILIFFPNRIKLELSLLMRHIIILSITWAWLGKQVAVPCHWLYLVFLVIRTFLFKMDFHTLIPATIWFACIIFLASVIFDNVSVYFLLLLDWTLFVLFRMYVFSRIRRRLLALMTRILKHGLRHSQSLHDLLV